MKYVWGRKRRLGWPSRKPVWTLTALLFAMLTICGMAVYELEAQWTALQRYWLPNYLKMQVAAGLGFEASDYRLLEVAERKGHRLAVEQDVVPLEGPLPKGVTVPLMLSDQAVKQGLHLVLEPAGHYKNEELKKYIQHWIYQDQTWGDFMFWPLVVGGCVGICTLLFALPADWEGRQTRIYGMWQQGPRLVWGSEFNRMNRSDGIGFPNLKRSWKEIILRTGKVVRIPRERERYHIMLMGDTGAGKSTLIRHILLQIEKRGETAIVYDPSLEYTPRFYRPERGDVMLNAADERTPHWNPSDEVKHEAEALTVATSLFPDDERENKFFMHGPRRIFAHLLQQKPAL